MQDELRILIALGSRQKECEPMFTILKVEKHCLTCLSTNMVKGVEKFDQLQCRKCIAAVFIDEMLNMGFYVSRGIILLYCLLPVGFINKFAMTFRKFMRWVLLCKLSY